MGHTDSNDQPATWQNRKVADEDAARLMRQAKHHKEVLEPVLAAAALSTRDLVRRAN